MQKGIDDEQKRVAHEEAQQAKIKKLREKEAAVEERRDMKQHARDGTKHFPKREAQYGGWDP